MPAAGRDTATAKPASQPATRWSWSTMAVQAARNFWHWRGASRPRCTTVSAWAWNRNRGSSEPHGEYARAQRTAGAVPQGRRPDAAQHHLLRADGGGDPDRIGCGHLHRGDRLLPQFLRPAGAAAVPAPQRPVRVPHAATATLPGALPDRRGLDAVRLLGHRPPADGAGDLAVVLGAPVRHHLRGDLAGRDRAAPALDR